MENFDYALKTEVLFGRDRISELGRLIPEADRNLLVIYGSRSAERIGIIDRLKELFRDRNLFFLSGIAPNPKLDKVREGIDICRKEKIQAIIAVGGGSVLDTSKAVAVGALAEEDIWDLITQSAVPKAGLPIYGVLTMAAAGSELGSGAVISNPETSQKLGFDSPYLLLQAVIEDPAYTASVPIRQTANGLADIFSHLLEQYFTLDDTYLSNHLCEAVMKTVIHFSPVLMKDPQDLEARSQIMWASSLANNGILSLGAGLKAFSVHAIEHEVSAFSDLNHGTGLAILTPHWMEYVLSDQTVHKFASYGRNVWDIRDEDDWDAAREAIRKTADFFRSLNLPSSLQEAGVSEADFMEMARQAPVNGFLDDAMVPLDENDVLNILKASY